MRVGPLFWIVKEVAIELRLACLPLRVAFFAITKECRMRESILWLVLLRDLIDRRQCNINAATPNSRRRTKTLTVASLVSYTMDIFYNLASSHNDMILIQIPISRGLHKLTKWQDLVVRGPWQFPPASGSNMLHILDGLHANNRPWILE